MPATTTPTPSAVVMALKLETSATDGTVIAAGDYEAVEICGIKRDGEHAFDAALMDSNGEEESDFLGWSLNESTSGWPEGDVAIGACSTEIVEGMWA
ncbi:MAG: hypothetical protein L6R38_001473 [Xanthoria sp. 2 TBL-2021]|nr:MAG: hypothetical protein L6R38_001473 [Xanthoria sp. 2 TBL-2021]